MFSVTFSVRRSTRTKHSLALQSFSASQRFLVHSRKHFLEVVLDCLGLHTVSDGSSFYVTAIQEIKEIPRCEDSAPIHFSLHHPTTPLLGRVPLGSDRDSSRTNATPERQRNKPKQQTAMLRRHAATRHPTQTKGPRTLQATRVFPSPAAACHRSAESSLVRPGQRLACRRHRCPFPGAMFLPLNHENPGTIGATDTQHGYGKYRKFFPQ